MNVNVKDPDLRCSFTVQQLQVHHFNIQNNISCRNPILLLELQDIYHLLTLEPSVLQLPDAIQWLYIVPKRKQL